VAGPGFFSRVQATVQTQASKASAKKPAQGWFTTLFQNLTSPQVLSSIGNIVAVNQLPAQQPSTGPITVQPYPPGVLQTTLPGAGALPLKQEPAQNMMPWLIGAGLLVVLLVRR
jgi:hypothetical protein